jgi:glutamate-1-semialdehyde 2,1-aminomutase
MTEISRNIHEEACENLPGGNTRAAVHYNPYPIYIQQGEGCNVVDVDGNEYIDFFNNATSLIHGHANKKIAEAAKEAINKGSAPGSPTKPEVKLAAHLTDRIESIERIRFTNSGTEATLQAIRLARAYTGKSILAKFEGIYHGTHGQGQISVSPPLHLAGPPEDPNSVPDSDGIHAPLIEDTVVLPFNSIDDTLAKLETYANELAGVMIHPLMGTNVIPGEKEFIRALDEFTTQNNIPLIFDEVVSSRIAYGGAQSTYNVSPDLTALGKIIGGGFPVGAVGGRSDIMSLSNPEEMNRVPIAGTFNANPVTMCAGITALEALSPEEITRINSLTDSLVEQARDIFEQSEISMKITKSGSLFNIYATDQEVTDYRSKASSSISKEKRLFHLLLEEGIRLSPNLLGAVSTPMTEEVINRFSTGLENSMERM